jgi:hypothetical protein
MYKIFTRLTACLYRQPVNVSGIVGCSPVVCSNTQTNTSHINYTNDSAPAGSFSFIPPSTLSKNYFMRSLLRKSKVVILLIASLFLSTALNVVFAADKCPNGLNITPTATQTLCLNGSATPLVATVTSFTSGGGTNMTYTWYSNTSNANFNTSGAGVTVVRTLNTTTSTTSDTYTPLTNATGTLYYYCVLTDATCGSTFVTGRVQVTVNSLPNPPTAPAAQSICSNSAQNFTFRWGSN